MQDAEASIVTVEKLKKLGVGIAIDDFGTGYSTMSQLNELPFNELKLDQRFIRNAARDAEARAGLDAHRRLRSCGG